MNLISSLLARIAQILSIPSEADALEAYLSKSVDPIDLERRQRAWDQRGRAPRDFPY